MPYIFIADGFHTQKKRNFVADFLQAKCDFARKTVVLSFGAPFGDLRATYDVHILGSLKSSLWTSY